LSAPYRTRPIRDAVFARGVVAVTAIVRENASIAVVSRGEGTRA